AILYDTYKAIGLQRFELRLNSMGDANCMPAYRESLVAYLSAHEDELCDEHRARWRLNPIRVLDCKTPECGKVKASAPRIADALCDDCAAALARVRAGLDAVGIPYRLDDYLVRGFDYYTRTTFEFASQALDGAQDAIGGGGRYDGLSAMLGGPELSGIGFGAGIERILLACDGEGVFPAPDGLLDAFVIDLTGGDVARDLTHRLRRAGFACDRAFDGRSMKAQLRAADRSGARFALIVGEEEAASRTVTLRPLRGAGEHQQLSVPMDSLEERLREIAAR
ncbi:MAG TPA: His/Gly/Thr/Pro-type tRNA ligase C-terminal domain-containing protein, partial [Acidimicrobiales bacterium]|nr:His/Gly/Thr/Pro-type tRNA ligase C-terminal domain-containing protein [Acidimicrobiales bacterium]